MSDEQYDLIIMDIPGDKPMSEGPEVYGIRAIGKAGRMFTPRQNEVEPEMSEMQPQPLSPQARAAVPEIVEWLEAKVPDMRYQAGKNGLMVAVSVLEEEIGVDRFADDEPEEDDHE